MNAPQSLTKQRTIYEGSILNGGNMKETCRKCGGSHPLPEPICTKYNGWANYETWCVNLWLTNDPGTDEDLTGFVRMKADAWKRAEALKGYVETMLPDLGATLAADLLGAALSEVDWQEIIESHEGDND